MNALALFIGLITSGLHVTSGSRAYTSNPIRKAALMTFILSNYNRLPPELCEIVKQFTYDNYWFLTDIQKKVLNDTEFVIDKFLVNNECEDIRIDYRENDKRIATVRYTAADGLIPIDHVEGHLTTLQFDCMNQILLQGRQNLSIQKSDFGTYKIIYFYTLNGMPPYLDRNIDYCQQQMQSEMAVTDCISSFRLRYNQCNKSHTANTTNTFKLPLRGSSTIMTKKPPPPKIIKQSCACLVS